jgi:hypothetical protein
VWKSGKKIKPVVMGTTDFRQFVAQQRTRKTKGLPNLPLLSQICTANFRKGSRALFYKTDFGSDYSEVLFLRPKFDIKTLPEVKAAARGIPTHKKTGILKLFDGVPAAKRLFWAELPTNDEAHDLIDNAE